MIKTVQSGDRTREAAFRIHFRYFLVQGKTPHSAATLILDSLLQEAET